MQIFSACTPNVLTFMLKSKRKIFFPCIFFPINNSAGIYLLKVHNRNTKTKCEICLALTIKTPERRQWRRSSVLIVNFEHISLLVLVFLWLTLRR